MIRQLSWQDATDAACATLPSVEPSVELLGEPFDQSGCASLSLCATNWSGRTVLD